MIQIPPIYVVKTTLLMSCSSTQEDNSPSPCLRGLARHFKTEPTVTIALFWIPEDTVPSSSVDEVFLQKCLCPLYCPKQGNIVSRKYIIHFVKKFCEPQRLMPLGLPRLYMTCALVKTAERSAFFGLRVPSSLFFYATLDSLSLA
jgi:hypothetical protein